MSDNRMTRRDMLRLAALGAVGAVASACAAPEPQVVRETVVVEKEVEVPVEVEVEVEKVVEVEVEVPVEVEVLVEAPEKDPVNLQANIAFTQSDYGLQYQIMQQWRDIFQQTYPWVTVDLAFVDWSDHHDKMLVLAAAGTLPDWIEVQASRSQLWALEGVFLATDDYVAADPDFAADDFFPEVMPYYQVEGRTYAYPYDHGPLILTYNVDMFDEFGVDYPDDTWTFDTLLETARIFTDPAKGTFGWTGLPWGGWGLEGTYLMPWGGMAMNEDETEVVINSPESVEALQWWADLRHVHAVHPTPAQSEVLAVSGGDFVSGKVAMGITAPWNAPTYNALASFDWDVAPYPEGPVARTTSGFGSAYGITSATEHPEEAWLFLRWTTSKEGLSFCWAASGGSTPPRKSVFDVYFSAPGVAPNAQAFLDSMNEYMVLGRPFSPAGPEFESVLGREIDLINLGLKPAQEAADTIKADGDPILAQNVEYYGG